jgi:cytochrome c oxidase assembly protein subunit 15
MGIHGVIEFGNRLLTFLLVIVAIATFLAVIRLRKQRRDLFVLALLIGLGIPAQAVIGGISVLMNLNPYVVGLHFVVSAVMIVLSTMLVTRVYRLGVRGEVSLLSSLAWLVALFQTITVLVGILVTGSGPHAGDAQSPRNGLPSELVQHIHSYPAYAALLCVALIAVYARRMGRYDVSRVALVLFAINFVQAGVGIAQSNLGLPEILVGLHMLLACLVISATTWLVITARRSERYQRVNRNRQENER